MKQIKTALILLLALGTNALMAQEMNESFNYFGLGYMELSSNSTTAAPEFSPAGVMVRLGHSFNPELALEFQSGFSNEVGTGTDTFKVNRVNSLFLRWSAGYERINLYTLIGMSRVTATVATLSEQRDGFSFGFGLSLPTGKSTDVVVEWANYITENAYRIDSLNIGFARHF